VSGGVGGCVIGSAAAFTEPDSTPLDHFLAMSGGAVVGMTAGMVIPFVWPLVVTGKPVSLLASRNRGRK